MTMIEHIELGIKQISQANYAGAEHIFLQLKTQFPDSALVDYLHSQVEGAIHAEANGTSAEKRLLNTFKEQVSHYSSVPEYNLNWALNDLNPIAEFLEENPLIVFDVGARDAFLGEIENLKQFINYYGFDADEDECNRINLNPPEGFKQFKIFPNFVGEEKSNEIFHIYKSPGMSSKFLLSERFMGLFTNGCEISKTINIKPISLKHFIDSEKVSSVDLIKLDTQGSELEILKSARGRLNKILMVESEVELTQMYDGQPIMGEYVDYMHTQGFEVLYINRVFQTRSSYPGQARGQITFSDFLFSKREDHFDEFSPVELAKHAILLCNYGHLDIAYDIWNGYATVKQLIPGLAQYFKGYDDAEKRTKQMGRDKLLCWQLHKRKTNQIFMDSDRSWPFR